MLESQGAIPGHLTLEKFLNLLVYQFLNLRIGDVISSNHSTGFL